MPDEGTNSWLTPDRRRFLAGLGAGVGTGLAGCTGGDGTPTEDPGSSDGDGGTSDGSTSVSVGIANGGWDLIPGLDTDFDSNKVYTLIYDNVVNLDPDGAVVPELATDWEQESETQFVFTLEEGVTFHNGSEFTAADVKYTYEWFGNNENPRQNYVEPVEDVVVEDDYTVRFDLSDPYGPFLYKVHAVMWPLSEEALDEHGEDYNQNPVGTGPYELTSWDSGNKAVLETYDDYWKDDLPQIDEIEFRILPEDSTKVTQLETGSVDLVDRILPNQTQRIENAENVDLLTKPGVSVGRVDFNTDVEPLADRRVRRALAWATDKQQIVDVVLTGFADPAKSVVPNSSPAYNDDVSDFDHPNGDPDRATELLSEAGYEDLSLEFLVPTRDRHENQASLLQSMFGEVGVDVTIRTMEGNAFFSTETEGDYEVAISNFTWFGDPDTLLYLFHADGLNLWNIDNQELNDLLDEQRRTVDRDERGALMDEIQTIIYEEAYSIFTYYPQRIQGLNTRIQGFEQYPNGSFRSLDGARVSE
jgi:peptide/nickel transport system substrate-binding protein